MTRDLVSVIIPTFNRAYSIAQSLRSVLDGSYPHIEVIVVDDGSTDGTENIIKEQFGDRVIFHKQAVRQGAAAARNTGIRLAKGDFIAFQDSDDEWLPEKLERQMKVFLGAPPTVGVVYSRLNKIIRGKNYIFPSGDIRDLNGNILNAMLRRNLVGMPTAVVRRECFDQVGFFDEAFPRLQDWELFIRISKQFQFICVDKCLLNVRERQDSLSANPSALIKAVDLLLLKHAADFNSGSFKEISARYHRLGWMMAAEGEYAMGRRYWAKALRRNPLNFKTALSYFASFAGKKLHTFLRNSKNALIRSKAKS